jgi:spoIIIJ-associated protein
MIREFEGKTEKEAIDNAIASLGLEKDDFDVEIVESTKSGFLFRKGNVKIRVHVEEEDVEADEPAGDYERAIVEFVEGLIQRMGFPGTVTVLFREEKKIGLGIDSKHSNILIGKKGKNLDALQLLANVYASKLNGGANTARIILDAEQYRSRREESLVRLARKSADQVRRSKGSRLLEPMNPFERRLIHTALNEMEDVDTVSEGEGLYKQVRIIYRGERL